MPVPPEGAGRLDIIRIVESGIKRIFELKIISEAQNRYEGGFTQLVYYLTKEDIDTALLSCIFCDVSIPIEDI